MATDIRAVAISPARITLISVSVISLPFFSNSSFLILTTSFIYNFIIMLSTHCVNVLIILKLNEN